MGWVMGFTCRIELYGWEAARYKAGSLTMSSINTRIQDNAELVRVFARLVGHSIENYLTTYGEQAFTGAGEEKAVDSTHILIAGLCL